MTISLTPPNGLQTPEEQTQALQKALQTIEKSFNQFSTSAARLLVPTVENSTEVLVSSTTSAPIPSYNFPFTSAGGVVCIDASISAYAVGAPLFVEMYLDGRLISRKVMGSGSAGTICFSQKTVVGTGSHILSFNAFVTGGTSQINPPTSASTYSEVTVLEMAQG